MDFLTPVSNLVRLVAAEYLPQLALGLVALFLALAVGLVVALVKVRRLRVEVRHLLRGHDGEDLKGMLVKEGELLREALREIEDLRSETRRLDSRLERCLQNLGVIRFNAFADTGSDLSFAVALLDASRNGVVITGLYGRDESRIYAKPIQGGESPYLLSREEKEALEKAVEQR